MKVERGIPLSLGVSILIGGIALVFALPEFAAGSRFVTSSFLFPYAFLLFHLIPCYGLLFPLMIAQFPIYGVFFGHAWSRGRGDWAAAWLFLTQVILGLSAQLLQRIDYSVSHGRYPF